MSADLNRTHILKAASTLGDTFYQKLQFTPGAQGSSWWADRTVKWFANAVIGIPGQIVASSLDTIIAYGLSIKAIASWGSNKIVSEQAAMRHLSAGRSLGYIYLSALKTVFPWAKVPDSAQVHIKYLVGTDPTLVKNGLLTHEFSSILVKKVDSLAESKNWAVRHLASRSLWVVGCIGRLALRVVDFALGILAAIGSIICLGRCATLNNYAARGLQITHIFTSDLYTGVMRTIDPLFFKRGAIAQTNNSLKLSRNGSDSSIASQ